ncbi:tRNA (uracil-5-)-methyltransferase homolog B-like [Planococcus citri]|uniref:tRNA (uracil-5-)-methyltransferase homolog B-like n=1 Tax=Planococcus citri TaxID=170843 RepID=UPI0031FA1F1F
MFKRLARTHFHPNPSLSKRWGSKAGEYVMKTQPELITVENQYDVLEDSVAPLCRLPYEKQLEYKEHFINDVIKELRTRVIGFTRKDLEILPLTPSPVIDHYRSKDEYNVRMGVDGDPKTYGLFTGRPAVGQVYSIRPIRIPVIKPKHNKILEIFEKYVKENPLPPCYNLNDGGFWRRVVVRSNVHDETMLVIYNHPQNHSRETIEKIEREVVEHFAAHDCHVDSMYHFLSNKVRCDTSNSEVSLIHGKPFIYETLLDHKFRISPDAFFQINVKAAEILHEEVMKLAQLKDNTTLLDLCCGVGTFSITASKHARHCIGIDNSFSSIEDAMHNAVLNNALNCEFMPGNVETRLKKVLESTYTISNLVVIANPGRSGLHPRAIEIIRDTSSIKRLVYISCKPDHVMTRQNFIDLMQVNKKKKGVAPFKLKKIKTIDLFPHTYHYEMILLFER